MRALAYTFESKNGIANQHFWNHSRWFCVQLKSNKKKSPCTHTHLEWKLEKKNVFSLLFHLFYACKVLHQNRWIIRVYVQCFSCIRIHTHVGWSYFSLAASLCTAGYHVTVLCACAVKCSTRATIWEWRIRQQRKI